jgi:hypothetical protein
VWSLLDAGFPELWQPQLAQVHIVRALAEHDQAVVLRDKNPATPQTDR